jgi:hypothetical protein
MMLKSLMKARSGKPTPIGRRKLESFNLQRQTLYK